MTVRSARTRTPVVGLLHAWDLTPQEAVEAQVALRSRVKSAPLRRSVRTVAGVDVAMEGETATAAVAILDYPGIELLDVWIARRRVDMPYIPGLLSFREAPAILDAFAVASAQPDLVLVDGQGIAHPRRLGIASHLGLLLDLPTVGCAKTKLCGVHDDPGVDRESHVPLTDGGETIGAVVRTRSNVRPVFVSVGHRTRLDQAIHFVLSCCRKYRLPEPIRAAHRAAGEAIGRRPATRKNASQW